MIIRKQLAQLLFLMLLGVSALSAEEVSYSTRTLSDEELQIVYHDLDQEVLEEHSFIFTDDELKNVALISTTTGKVANKALEFLWKSPTSEGGYFPVPEAVPNSWSFIELRAVSFGDFNGDGLGPDMIAIADYMLPGTAIPSPVATVYFHQKPYSYTTDKKLNKHLYSRATRTTVEARTRIKTFLAR